MTGGAATDVATTRRYRVTHRTTYDYDDVVSASFGRCFLTPRDLPGQRVSEAAIVVDPEPADRSTGTDIFGNSDTYFHVRTPHHRLEVTGTSLVDVDPLDPGLLTCRCGDRAVGGCPPVATGRRPRGRVRARSLPTGDHRGGP